MALLATIALVFGAVGGYAATSTFEVGNGGGFGADGGPEVTVGPATQVPSGNPVESGTVVNISGTEFESSGDTEAHIDKLGTSSEWTNVSELSVSTNALTIRPENKQETTVSGGISELSLTDVVVDDGTVDFAYSGSSGSTTISLEGVPASTTIGAADVKTGELLDVSTSSGSGSVTFDLPNSDHAVNLETTSGGPSLSNGQPSGLLSSRPTTLSVDVSDPDFPQDELEVDFEVDGQDVGSTIISSSGTADVTVSSQNFVGGEHTVDVVATDAYGQTDSLSYTFSVPSELEIRNESKPSELVDNATVEVSFYYRSGGEFQSVTRSTSNGTLNLEGLPVDRPLVASAEADGFKNRRIFISSLYQQQTLYLLPDSAEFVRTTFQLQDFSGEFPQDVTVLRVERVLNGTTYDTVVGDYFGANGQFPAELAFNERHRLTLINTRTGQTRPLGTYTPLSSGEQELAISVSGQIDPVGADGSFAAKPTADLLPDQNLTLELSVRNGSAPIDSYEISIYQLEEDGSNSTLATLTGSSAETRTVDVNLSGATGGELKIVTTASTENGGFKRTKTYGVIERDDESTSLLPQLDALKGLLPSDDRDPFTTAVAMIVTLVGTAGAASRFRLSTEVVGVAGIGFLTGFAILGWVGYDLLFVAVVAWGALAIARRQL
jgi:hypothetical protein